MKQLRERHQRNLHKPAHPMNRREADRVSVEFKLMYSGEQSNGEILMGDGRVVDLSHEGLGISGTDPVQQGMELTLFLYLPDGQDPLFVMETRVAWVKGHRFGVELQKMNLRERNRLHYFLQANSVH
jgi:PilZ domain